MGPGNECRDDSEGWPAQGFPARGIYSGADRAPGPPMTAPAPALPGFKPLYQQVKDLLIGRLIGGHWKPGDLLPSEIQLAEELGVSQGTVRKALDEMTAGNLLVRRQGRGTYVAEHDQEHALFHFFKLADRAGRPLVPESRVVKIALGPA